METDTATEAVHLSCSSPDGEEGYPGQVEFTVVYHLDGPRLICEMTGHPDRPTPINLAQHNYDNLAGTGTCSGPCPDDRCAGLHARRRGDDTGRRDPQRVGHQARLHRTAQPQRGRSGRGRVRQQSGAARRPRPRRPRRHRRLSAQRGSSRTRTGEPALQIYDDAHAPVAVPGHDGQTYGAFSGLCLEAQHSPDSLNNPDWPSIVRSPEHPYFQRLSVEVARA